MSISCKNCKTSFTIEPDDFAFYAKIAVPSSTLCPDCRYQRRLAHRNERTLYERKCSATGKEIVAIYPENTPFPVYEQKFWESGNWDSLQYGRGFDFSKPFFEQFRELQQVVPRVNLRNFESVNSEYTNQCDKNKNCYLLVASNNCENVMYSNWAIYCKDTLDVYNTFKGEGCYESINCQYDSSCFWCKEVENSFDCWFSYDLKGCNNCFLSANLRNKSYYWQNQPLPKTEWIKKFREIETGSFTHIQSLRGEWLKVMQQALHRFASQRRVQNVSGDMLFECKNVYKSFNVTRGENCKYCQDIIEAKDCWDSTEVGLRFALGYENHGSARIPQSFFCNICWESYDLLYCDLCSYSSNLFGCIALKHKKYCILNKQYSKESFNKLKTKIIEHMKKTGEWGEFFPITLSVFAYNETTALEYFPLTEQEVLAKGWKWDDNLPGTSGKRTVQMQKIPDDIKDIPNSILEEILTCTTCKKNYRLVPHELTFYRKLSLPIPRLCPNCRHYARLALRNPRKLWHRKCMCDILTHEWHSTKHCPNEFETTYGPERKEIVYCERCYQIEIV